MLSAATRVLAFSSHTTVFSSSPVGVTKRSDQLRPARHLRESFIDTANTNNARRRKICKVLFSLDGYVDHVYRCLFLRRQLCDSYFSHPIK